MTAPETAYAELQVTTNFSFLRGASHAHELVATAQALGLSAVAVTDRNTLAGVVRMHAAAKERGVRLVIGCRLDLEDGPSLLCLPTDRAAYGRLARLLTHGKMPPVPKGECRLTLADVQAHAEGQIFIAIAPDSASRRGDLGAAGGGDAPPREKTNGAADRALHPLPAREREFETVLRDLARLHPGRVFLAASHLRRGDDRARIAALADLARTTGAPLVATGDVLHHTPARRPLQDVLTCIREGCAIQDAGRRLEKNADRHLKPPEEMAHRFRGFEDAVARSVEIAERCRFSLDELKYEYPDEPVPPGASPQAHLESLTWRGAAWRYPDGVPDKVRALLKKELALVAELDYAPYFLTVHDIVAWARAQAILCQGRGSAANSAVCYCLGVTAVDPTKVDLLFERFLSKERKEPPDIDVDFEHERREEVIQYIYARYGRLRAGLTATVISYRARSAVRETCKALGLTEDVAAALAGTVWGSWGMEITDTQIREAGLDPANPLVRRAIDLTGQLIGFPRHLSQHVGGFILTRGPLCETVPIGAAAMDDRTFIEWDKDDIDELGILKVDVLGLGMLTCIRKCFDLIEAHGGDRLSLATVPAEDPAVYDMLCAGDSLGVFQVESRAQMAMLPRLKPRCFYDLVIEVAIVRPGPIQGDMVHPYLRRRKGLEPVEFPSPHPDHGPPDELERVLGKTLGVPLFQEQAMRVAIEAAKFTPDEANGLRKAMATFRRNGSMHAFEDKMIDGMTRRGYASDFAKRCFDQIKGFGDYGFPESHSASFSLLVYVSAWLKKHRPEVFACGLLNAQPMGFYAPAQIVRDARDHGVDVRPVDVGASDWDNTLEPANGGLAVRLGFRQVDGLSEAPIRAFVARRGAGFRDVDDMKRRGGLSRPVLEKLAAADAFRSLGLDRRQALWAVRGLGDGAPAPLFDHADAPEAGPEPEVRLPEMALSEHVVHDYETVRLSLKAHPMSFLRARLAAQGVRPSSDLPKIRDGAPVAVAGVVLVRQRPGTAKGVVFMTIEDETGVANVVIWAKVMERHRKTLMGGRLILVRGRVQAHDGVIHVVADELVDRTGDLALLSETEMPAALARADEVAKPGRDPTLARHPRDVRVLPKSRDFH